MKSQYSNKCCIEIINIKLTLINNNINLLKYNY